MFKLSSLPIGKRIAFSDVNAQVQAASANTNAKTVVAILPDENAKSLIEIKAVGNLKVLLTKREFPRYDSSMTIAESLKEQGWTSIKSPEGAR